MLGEPDELGMLDGSPLMLGALDVLGTWNGCGDGCEDGTLTHAGRTDEMKLRYSSSPLSLLAYTVAAGAKPLSSKTSPFAASL